MKTIFIFDNFLEATKFLPWYFCRKQNKVIIKNYILNRIVNKSPECPPHVRFIIKELQGLAVFK